MKGKLKSIRLDYILLSVILLVANLLPFANYTYKKTDYTLSGLDFITGKTVMGGSVQIGTDILLVVTVLGSLLLLVLGFLKSKVSDAMAGRILFVVSLVSVITYAKIASGVAGLLSEAKQQSAAWGVMLLAVVSAAALIRSMRILKAAGKLSSLDFMTIPGLLYLLVNNYLPMIGISLAFKKIDYRLGIWESPWTGLDNFKMLFSYTGSFFESDAFIITRNTLLYNIVFIALGVVTGILAAVCLHGVFRKRLQKFYQTSILLPQLISMVIVAYIVYALLSNETGMINKMLGDNAVNFYAEKQYWPFILVFIQVWKQLGYNAIIFLSSLVGIDKSIYEASRVDGANRWQTLWSVTLPMLRPTIITIVLLQVSRIFYSDFGLFYQVPMDSGALYAVTNTIDTYVYRCLMVLNNISTASAASAYQAVVGFIIVLGANLLVRRADKENALF